MVFTGMMLCANDDTGGTNRWATDPPIAYEMPLIKGWAEVVIVILVDLVAILFFFFERRSGLHLSAKGSR
jgi:hypothetical protein